MEISGKNLCVVLGALRFNSSAWWPVFLRQFFLGSGLGQKFIIVTLDVPFIITIVKVM